MKIAIVGPEYEKALPLLQKHGDFFEVTENNPEVVISYGGDGTLMEAEHLYPGVPKLYLRNSHIAKLAHQTKENEEILEQFVKGRYKIQECFKLEATAKSKTLVGLNDIVVHNENPRHSIRYTVQVDSGIVSNEIIGDGLVFATPLGSTGYYRSITDSSFEIGIGLAFNNSTEQSDHIVLQENRVIKVKITRGPAFCYADNQKEYVELLPGEMVEVRKSSLLAKIIRV